MNPAKLSSRASEGRVSGSAPALVQHAVPHAWLRPSSRSTRRRESTNVRASMPNANGNELDWTFPSYLVTTSGRPFPCQEGLDPSTTRPGTNKKKWKREDAIWQRIRQEAAADAASEPLLSSFLYASILAHDSFEKSLAFVLSNRLADTTLLPTQLFEIFVDVLSLDDDMLCGALADVEAGIERDPACMSMVQVILNCKGFQAIQTHRVAHSLWTRGKRVMALALQSRGSEVFAVDIHPGARIGKGILLDHGTGVVIGETAVIGDNCSMLQNVTLGGTGKEVGDRHPKVGNNVLIGASATVLGNITIGNGSMIGAGSLVLKPVAPRAMVAGSPAKEVGMVEGVPAKTMEQRWEDESCCGGDMLAQPQQADTAAVVAEAARAQPWPPGSSAPGTSSTMPSTHSAHSSQQGASASHVPPASAATGSTHRGGDRAEAVSPMNVPQPDPNELLAAQRDQAEAAQASSLLGVQGEGSGGDRPAGSGDANGQGPEQGGVQEPGQEGGVVRRPKAPTAWGPVASIRGEGI